MHPRHVFPLLLVAACVSSSQTSDLDVLAITALRDSIQAAEGGGRADGMLAAFAEDVIVMAPGMPALDGKAAAGDFLRGALGTTNMTVHYTSAEMVVSGDWAFDRGTYHATMSPKAGGATTEDQGKYLWLLHRGPDGHWKYHRITWNADAAPASGS